MGIFHAAYGTVPYHVIFEGNFLTQEFPDRSRCIRCSSGIYTICPAPEVVVPLPRFIRNFHLKRYRPGPGFQTQTTGWWILPEFRCLVFDNTLNVECLELAGEVVPDKTTESEGNTFRQVLRTKAVHLIALFTLIYEGVEVTMGGEIDEYLGIRPLIPLLVRLDRHLHNWCARRWFFIWIHFVRFLRRCVSIVRLSYSRNDTHPRFDFWSLSPTVAQ